MRHRDTAARRGDELGLGRRAHSGGGVEALRGALVVAAGRLVHALREQDVGDGVDVVVEPVEQCLDRRVLRCAEPGQVLVAERDRADPVRVAEPQPVHDHRGRYVGGGVARDRGVGGGGERVEAPQRRDVLVELGVARRAVRVVQVALEAAPEQLAERVTVAHAVEQGEGAPHPPGAEVDRDPLGVGGVGVGEVRAAQDGGGGGLVDRRREQVAATSGVGRGLARRRRGPGRAAGVRVLEPPVGADEQTLRSTRPHGGEALGGERRDPRVEAVTGGVEGLGEQPFELGGGHGREVVDGGIEGADVDELRARRDIRLGDEELQRDLAGEVGDRHVELLEGRRVRVAGHLDELDVARGGRLDHPPGREDADGGVDVGSQRGVARAARTAVDARERSPCTARSATGRASRFGSRSGSRR